VKKISTRSAESGSHVFGYRNHGELAMKEKKKGLKGLAGHWRVNRRVVKRKGRTTNAGRLAGVRKPAVLKPNKSHWKRIPVNKRPRLKKN